MQIAYFPYVPTRIFILFMSPDQTLDTLTSPQINAFQITPSPWASLIHAPFPVPTSRRQQRMRRTELHLLVRRTGKGPVSLSYLSPVANDQV